MTSLFCRHNRFTADCPICSKNTVLSREPAERARPSKPTATRSKPRPKAAAGTVTRYPHASVQVRGYEVRLEKVPGGLRLGQWRGGVLERRAPVLPASALRELLGEARGRGYVAFDLLERGQAADRKSVASAGRAGDMQEELRLEHAGEPGFVRVARWLFWPGEGVGWELQDAPVMLPEKRYEQVLSHAAAAGLI
ncbi:MAG TPA: hypothetical protein VH300_18745 [Thermoleophilaceae bacterium]|jgi:hypothetical protein|nr:hypothetical protein [Thermoleophilaceae bacterium]